MGLISKLFRKLLKEETKTITNVKLAVIYYSMGGTNYQMARWAEEGAIEAGAEVKVLKVPELAPQSAIEGNPIWKAHVEATKDVQEVQLADLDGQMQSFSACQPVLVICHPK